MPPSITTASADNAELIVQAARLDVSHAPGSPFYSWLGHLFALLPFGEIATRLNFLSALCGALTLAIFFMMAVRHLGISRFSAAIATLFLGLSTIFWSQAVIAELYTLNMALLTFSIYALFEWAELDRSGSENAPPTLRARRVWLVVAFVSFAAGLGTHLSNALYLPALFLFVLLGLPGYRREGMASYLKRLARSFDYAGAALAVLAGLAMLVLPYVWLYFALDTARQPAGATPIATGWPRFSDFVFNAWSTWRFYYGFPYLPEHIAIFSRLVWYSFGPMGAALSVLGVWPLARSKPRIALTLGLLMCANLVFYLTYRAPDVQVFYLPAFWAIAFFLGAGLDTVFGWLTKTARSVKLERASAGITVFLLAVVVGLLWGLPQSIRDNDLRNDVQLRDFYGNLLSGLPANANYYQRGGGMLFPLLYYTELYGVRPDVRVFAGSYYGEPTDQAWPDAPTYSGSTSRDFDLPAFLTNATGASGSGVTKWFDAYLFGMYRWNTPLMLTETGWLKSYKVLPAPPENWLLPAGSAESRPSVPLSVTLPPSLTLLGIDVDAEGAQGKSWRMVRYWRATSADLPYVATSLIDAQGSRVATQFNVPLSKQMRDYIEARNIAEADLPDYVLREEIHLVLPSYIPPGRYSIAASLIKGQLAQQLYDPALEGDMLPGEQKVTQIDVRSAPAPDPLK